MNQLLVAFITGVTTGGLSCLAVQGGLLASSLENQLEQQLDQQIEQEISARRAHRSGKKRSRSWRVRGWRCTDHRGGGKTRLPGLPDLMLPDSTCAFRKLDQPLILD